MESWILILLSVGFMIFGLVSKNKKEYERIRQKRAAEDPESSSDEEDLSVPDIFSTIFGFEEPNQEQKQELKREIVEVESKSFHDQFEDAVAKEVREEVETESLYRKYQTVVAPVEEETVNMAEVATAVKFDDNEIGNDAIVRKSREKIDPRKMIIYSELLKPKYKEV